MLVPIHISDQPTGNVVLRRHDRNEPRHGVNSMLPTGLQNVGESAQPHLLVETRASSHTCGRSVSPIRRMIAFGDHIAGSQLSHRMLAHQESLACVVEQHCTLAAQCLGNQRLLTSTRRPEPQDRRVELDELDIRHLGSCAQAERQPVTGGDGRVGRGRKYLANSACRQDDSRSERCTDPITLTLTHDVQRSGLRGPFNVNQQVQHQGMFNEFDAVVLRDRIDECPADLDPGGVAARVRDPVALMPTFTSQR